MSVNNYILGSLSIALNIISAPSRIGFAIWEMGNAASKEGNALKAGLFKAAAVCSFVLGTPFKFAELAAEAIDLTLRDPLKCERKKYKKMM